MSDNSKKCSLTLVEQNHPIYIIKFAQGQSKIKSDGVYDITYTPTHVIL